MVLAEIENLSIEKINKDNKSSVLFKNFSFQIKESECIGLYAPTGKGKTTLLNYIAQIIPEKSGFKIDGKIKYCENLKTSYVFQNFGLIQYLTVMENVLLPVTQMKGPSQQETAAAEKILNDFWLYEKKDEKVINLSGGEKQRVALARAFLYPGKLLLLDEPFAFQDSEKTEELIIMTKNVFEREHRGGIMISHKKEELGKVCSKIINEQDFIQNI